MDSHSVPGHGRDRDGVSEPQAEGSQCQGQSSSTAEGSEEPMLLLLM